MITRAKNNYNKVYILKDLCKKSNFLECSVKNIKYYKNPIIYGGRIVIGFCACECGKMQYSSFKGNKKKFDFMLSNGLSVEPIEFV